MTRTLAAALVISLTALGANLGAEGTVEQHHYSIAARVRPLLLFWISRSGVGDAVLTRRVSADESVYALLIGSDPDRAPRRINRWGYIKEEIRGSEARLVGLMTESEEESIEQAEANLKTQARGAHPFKIIRATVNGGQARSVVTSIAAPQDYTFRQLETVLELARRESSDAPPRILPLPSGTRPGFLAALTDAMQAPAGTIRYVYHGKLYDLHRTAGRTIPDVRIGNASYGRGIAADFLVTNLRDGEQTRFSMTYGTEGRFAHVPLSASYQPRWWMEVSLTIDDAAPIRLEGLDR